ncbi:DinB family protein [Deinococcus sp. HMF7604]|uniref:DinB family protein n=1 Tax=Deinococcus betulae TaxID=2873312 RepID=UPI001CCB4CDA|nr:DinB family protein [Deinococcus betulae]MBZ9750222.1 DinB family protein [Deinococcus betulae]
MTLSGQAPCLDALLASWQRNNSILLNLLQTLPDGALALRTDPDSPSVGQVLSHLHFVRLVLVEENAPDLPVTLPSEEWMDEENPERLAHSLMESAQLVGVAVQSRLKTGRAMDRHYDHPVLFIQHLLWHEGYHYGQIKLMLKWAGQPLADDVMGPQSWGLFMRKSVAADQSTPDPEQR